MEYHLNSTHYLIIDSMINHCWVPLNYFITVYFITYHLYPTIEYPIGLFLIIMKIHLFTHYSIKYHLNYLTFFNHHPKYHHFLLLLHFRFQFHHHFLRRFQYHPFSLLLLINHYLSKIWYLLYDHHLPFYLSNYSISIPTIFITQNCSICFYLLIKT